MSSSSAGDEGNQHAGGPLISADGGVVAFSSAASNLVPADTNAGANQFGIGDVYVRDLVAGTTERVSVSSHGAEASAVSGGSGISADGRFVTFQSSASNLVPGDTNSDSDLFLHDRATGLTERISVKADGSQVDGGLFGSSTAAPNADGSVVAFASDQPGIVPGDTGLGFDSDIFVRRRGPALGVAELRAQPGQQEIAVDGAATFSGLVAATATDAAGDGVEPIGADLSAVEVIVRPEAEDLQIRLAVTKLPGVRGPNVPPFQPGIFVPGTTGAPAVVHGLRFTVGGVAHEVRAMRVGAAAAPPGAPLFALHRCEIVCLETARLSGGYGSTGDEIRVSVPLQALGLAVGGELQQVRAFAGIGEAAAGAVQELDTLSLPDATITAPRVEVGLAMAGTPPSEVTFDHPVQLTAGLFSTTIPIPAGAAPGPWRVWARACLGSSCEPSSIPAGI